LGMECPFADLSVRCGIDLGADGVTDNELGFDRLFAVCKLGQRSHLLSSPAVGGSRKRVETQSIRRAIEAGLHTIVAVAFIHQPILPLSRVAFLAH
jgi:hypothetical protein